jgi:hypothetical protein
MFDGRVNDMLTRVNDTFQVTYNYKWLEFKASNKSTVINFLLRLSPMPPVGFEPTFSAAERPQPYALDRTATGTVAHISFN